MVDLKDWTLSGSETGGKLCRLLLREERGGRASTRAGKKRAKE